MKAYGREVMLRVLELSVGLGSVLVLSLWRCTEVLKPHCEMHTCVQPLLSWGLFADVHCGSLSYGSRYKTGEESVCVTEMYCSVIERWTESVPWKLVAVVLGGFRSVGTS